MSLDLIPKATAKDEGTQACVYTQQFGTRAIWDQKQTINNYKTNFNTFNPIKNPKNKSYWPKHLSIKNGTGTRVCARLEHYNNQSSIKGEFQAIENSLMEWNVYYITGKRRRLIGITMSSSSKR